MSFSPRRSGDVGSARTPAPQLVRWLTGSLLAGTPFIAAVPYSTTQPYLATTAPAPLRFAPPPPDVSTQPAPTAPPNPDGVIGDVAQSNAEAVAPAPRTEPAPAVGAEVPPAPGTPAIEQPTGPAPGYLPIIPDDLPPQVRPEDLLPYFLPPQIPAAPASQATYRLK